MTPRKLALFEQLPDAITLVDAFDYVRIYDELDHAENMGREEQVRAFRAKARMLLEDLVHKYNADPTRAQGENTISHAELVAKVRRLHPGEDPL